jgi:DNA-binding NarL/FixJ family response regulator
VNGPKLYQARRTARGCSVRPKQFVFFDKKTSTRRFAVDAAANGAMPIEQAVSLLAMQCVVRGQTPGDFAVMVSAAGENLMDSLIPRANKLIESCMANALPLHMSRRQQEVLRGVTQNLSNKEIASKLNIAERTVKFHVSALLQKFHVDGRVNLTRKASDMLSGTQPQSDNPPIEMPSFQTEPGRSSLIDPKLIRMAVSDRRAR